MVIEEIVEINIDDIRIKKRIRSKDVSVDSLIESIKTYGLLQPIVVDENKTLIAGYRRVKACKALNFSTILAKVVKVKNDEIFLLLEMEENTSRIPFSSEELLSAQKRLEKLRHPNFFVWLWRQIKAFFTGKRNN